MAKRLASAFVLASLASWPQCGWTQSGDYSSFEGDETFTFVGDFGQLKGEHIDPRTRILEWQVTDLVVPGNGGLDLTIGRTQPNLGSFSTTGEYNYVYLSDWDLDLPRIVKAVPPQGFFGQPGTGHCANHELTGIWQSQFDEENWKWAAQYRGPLTLQLPGAAPELLLVKHQNATQFPAAAKYVTTNNTIVECAPGEGFIVRTAEGMTYHLTEVLWWAGDVFDGNVGGKFVYLPTLIVDAQGNTLTFEYSARVWLSVGNGSAVALNRIVASDGRIVEFQYNDWVTASVRPRLQKILFDGKEWSFFYTALAGFGYYLSQVTDPVGRSWQYEYLAGMNYKVTLPTGATVTYDLEQHADPWQHQYGSGATYSKVVVSRTVSGLNIPTSVSSLTYEQQQYQEVTTITGPQRIVKHTFRRGWNNISDDHMLTYADAGQLLKTEIFEVGSPNTLLRTIDFGYTPLAQIGLYDIYGGPAAREFQSRPIRLTWHRVTDNLTNAMFYTLSTNLDVYGNPQTVEEQGTLNRQTNITYRNTTTPWIVGQRDTEQIVGIGTIDRDYYSNGLLERLDRYGVVETYEYHPTGDLHKKKWVRDGVNHEIVYTDYYRGTPRAESHPEGVSLARVVNATGTVHSQTDGKGYQTTFAYDAVNRLTQIAPPEGAVTTIQWLSPTQVLRSRGDYRQQRSFDTLGRLLLEETWDQSWGAGQRIYRRRLYDAENRLSFESVPSNSASEAAGVQNTYDALDRVKTALNTADSTSRSYCYGNACRVASTDYAVPLQLGFIETDERGYDTAYEHDAFGNPDERNVAKISRQVRTAGEAGGLKFIDTIITHDDAGAIDTVSQGGYSRQHIYNAQRQLWKLIEPETGTTEMTYDSVGNLKTRKVGSSGVTTYFYDGRNRRVTIDNPAPTTDVSFIYDQNDNLDYLTSGTNVWDYSYDTLNRLKTETLASGSQMFGFTHYYSATGGLESTVYPSGATITFQPDGLGRPTRVGSYVTLASYHPGGTPQLIRFGNGQEATLTLTSRRLPDQYTTTDGISNVVNLNYDYDSTGNVQAIMDYLDSLRNRSMSYDGAARLTVANGHWGAGSMTYDDIGNLKTMALGSTSLTYWYDGQNRLDYTTGSVAYDFSYDAYGNAVTNGFDSYLFNAASQMTAVPSIPGTSYSYDGNGMRATATMSSGTTYSAYGQNGQLLLTKELPSDVTSEYYYLGERLVAKRAFGAGVDDDLDDDGLTDDVELLLGLNPSSAADASADLDGDGATNLAEYQAGALLNDADTDNDGMNDGYELRYGLNVTSIDSTNDPDGDSLTNLQESQLNTNPYDNDTDNDGVPDNLDPNPTFNPALIPIINFILEN